MAANNKGTRADKAVSEAKKKASNGKNTTKSAKNTAKKPAPAENKKASAVNTELAYQFPVNAVIAIITGFLFVFFLFPSFPLHIFIFLYLVHYNNFLQ